MATFAASLSASSTPWIAEDDLLLKNAVEAGASLEALAKGAVRFSRKFSIQELQDRWYSLLYDPVISAEASARMLEFERSASNNLLKSLGSGVTMDNAEVTPKQKSLREMYHALRKRTCIRPMNSSNLSFIGLPHLSGQFEDGTGSLEHGKPRTETPVGSSMLGVCAQNHYGLQDVDLEFLDTKPHDNNLMKEAIDYDIFKQGNMHEDSGRILGKTLVDMETSHTIEGMESSRALPQESVSYHSLGENIESSSALPESDLAHLSDSLLNFSNENEFGFTEGDREDPTDKSSNENADSVLLGFPDGFKEDTVMDVKEPLKIVTVHDESSLAVLKDADARSHLSQINEPCSFSSEVNESSSSAMPKPQPQPHQVPAEERICVLNSEDPEIPCNDDFVPSKGMRNIHKRPRDTASSFLAVRKDSGQKLSMLPKEDNSIPSFPGSTIGGPVIFGGIGHEHPVSNAGVKTKTPVIYHPAGLSGQNSSVLGVPNQGGPFTTLNSLTHEGLKEKSQHASFGKGSGTLHKISSLTADTFPRPTSNPSPSDPEASQDQDIADSDDDIPNFSDIESMILDMDLCPDDPDPRLNREMSRYQHEDSRRTIIRLEQCAQSSMQRAIAYRGAFAVFYGRHMKHYIKKSKVVLGRATNESNVDIDLGREGLANKISREQAIIRLETDGSFIFKNLGRSPVFVNGKEIPTGQGLVLKSGNLIEIRDMAFVFEINQNAVKRHMETVANTNQGKNNKYQWSAARPPGSVS